MRHWIYTELISSDCAEVAKNDYRVPVLVVGAGVAGLSASALLAQRGIRSLLAEKRREVFIYPKARNLSFRSLEILRGLGLAEQVHAVADLAPDAALLARPDGIVAWRANALVQPPASHLGRALSNILGRKLDRKDQKTGDC